MIDFVGIPPFLRIALRFAMVTMHFNIAQINLFIRNVFYASRGPIEQFGTHEKLSWRCKVGQIRCRG